MNWLAYGVIVFALMLLVAGMTFNTAPHIFYFNVLVDDQDAITEFQCFCYKEYYDKFEFTGSSGPGELKKEPGRVIEIWDIKQAVEND